MFKTIEKLCLFLNFAPASCISFNKEIGFFIAGFATNKLFKYPSFFLMILDMLELFQNGIDIFFCAHDAILHYIR
jgi:hypothetical protein